MMATNSNFGNMLSMVAATLFLLLLSPLPPAFFGLLAVLPISYLLMVEGVKQWLYGRLMKA